MNIMLAVTVIAEMLKLYEAGNLKVPGSILTLNHMYHAHERTDGCSGLCVTKHLSK